MDSNVFLVPCDSDNFDRTVCSEIDVTEYSDYPPALSDVNKVRLWGAREGSNNQKYFEKMESSDLLLFYQDDTYIGTGRVGTKFIDEEGWVSTTFWDGAPSYYIYTIEEFTAVSVPKSKVNRIFDYDLDYYPEGLIPVAEIDLVTILRRLNLFYRDTAKNTDEGTVNTMADHDFLRRSVIPVRGRTRSLRQGFV